MRGGLGTSDPGRLSYPYSTLTALLMTAYGLKSYQVVGPEWLETDHYEVTAKVPGGATREQVNEMLRNLLAERFKMTVHTEQREMAVYNLVVASGGPKLTKSAPDSTGGLGFRLYGARTTLIGKKMRVDGILGTLIREMERPVLDHTGLTDDYDITLDFANQRVRDMGRPASTSGDLPGAPDPGAPPLPAALQQQLGLKLEAARASVSVLVVDKVEKTPIEN